MFDLFELTLLKMTYYLKYRPKKFSDLFGLEEAAGSLQKALAKGQVAHAYIFTGPKGSGKTTAARILAKALNCQRGAEPCNECSVCLDVNEGRFLDLIEIDGASNRGIDDVRDLREKIKLAPSRGQFKVYIIDEAHMLTLEAFNALLKTLEEPPAHAVFILATTEYQKIPETIKSRCQTLRFHRAGRADLAKKLKFICQSEGVELASEKISEIIELADGSFRNAETLLEQVVVGELNLERLNFSAPAFVEALIKNDQLSALNSVAAMATAGESLAHFSRSLIIYLRGLLLVLAGLSAEELEDLSWSYSLLKEQSESLGKRKLLNFLSRFLLADDQLKYSPIPQLPLELAIFDLTEAAVDIPLENKVGLAPTQAGVGLSEEGRADLLRQRWDEVLKMVRPYNHSLEALLRSARPRGFGPKGELVVEVFYKFHKEKLSQSQNLNALQTALFRILGSKPKVVYVLGKKTATENPSGDGDLVSAALAAFL